MAEIKIPIEVSMKPSASNLQRFAKAVIAHLGSVRDSSEESCGLTNILVAVRVSAYKQFIEELAPNGKTMFAEVMEAAGGSNEH